MKLPLKKFLGAEDLMDCATDHGSIEIVELLFEKGIKVKGTNAIQIAISNENIDIVKVLVKNGAIIDSGEYEEFPPLHRLCLRVEYKMMQFLIDHGANVDVLGGEEYKETLLHIAAAAPFPSLDLAKFMIKNGANVNSKCGTPWADVETEGGSTPLHFAIIDDNNEFAEMLINIGADLNIPNFKGKNSPSYCH